MAEHHSTLLHWLIEHENWTMAAAADKFQQVAREARIDATMSERHLRRIVRRTGQDGMPSASTRRVLSLMFNRPIEELLSPPSLDPAIRVGASTGIGGEVDMAAERARAFGARANTQLTEQAMEQIYDEVRTLADRLPPSAGAPPRTKSDQGPGRPDGANRGTTPQSEAPANALLPDCCDVRHGGQVIARSRPSHRRDDAGADGTSLR